MDSLVKIQGEDILQILTGAEDVLDKDWTGIVAKIAAAKTTIRSWIFFKKEVSLKDAYHKRNPFSCDWSWDAGKIAQEAGAITERERKIVEMKDLYNDCSSSLGRLPLHKGACYLTVRDFNRINRIEEYLGEINE